MSCRVECNLDPPRRAFGVQKVEKFCFNAYYLTMIEDILVAWLFNYFRNIVRGWRSGVVVKSYYSALVPLYGCMVTNIER